jgi:hypothetical protein
MGKIMQIIILILLFISSLFGGTGLATKLVINQKHQKPINLYINSEKYLFTYSKEEILLKVWHLKTLKLVKEFKKIYDVQKLLLYKDKLHIIGTHNLRYIDLNFDGLGMYSYYDTQDEFDYEEKAFLIKNTKIINDFLYIPFHTREQYSPKSSVGFLKIDTTQNGSDKMNEYVDKNYVSNYPDHVSNYIKDVSKLYIHNSGNLMLIEDEKNIPQDLPRVLELNSHKLYQAKNNKLYFDIKYKNNPKNFPYTTAINECGNTNILLNNKPIYNGVAGCGSCCPDSKFVNSFYTTNKGHIITTGYIGWTITPDYRYTPPSGFYFFVFDKNGKLLRQIEKITKPKIETYIDDEITNQEKINDSNLKIFNDQNYIIWGNKLEMLDEDFKTIKTFKYPSFDEYDIEGSDSKIITNDVVFIEKIDKKLKVYFEDNSILYFDIESTEYSKTEYFFENGSSVVVEAHNDYGYIEYELINGNGDYQEYIHYIDVYHNVSKNFALNIDFLTGKDKEFKVYKKNNTNDEKEEENQNNEYYIDQIEPYYFDDEYRYYDKDSRQVLNGLVKIKYRSGKLFYKHEFIDGIFKDGECEEYYENGNIKSLKVYSDNFVLMSRHFKEDGELEYIKKGDKNLTANFFGTSEFEDAWLDMNRLRISYRHERYQVEISAPFSAYMIHPCQDVDTGYEQIRIAIPPMHSDLSEDYTYAVVLYNKEKDKFDVEYFSSDVLFGAKECSIKAYKDYEEILNKEKNIIYDIYKSLLGDVEKLDVAKLKEKPQKLKVNKISNEKIQALLKKYPDNFYDINDSEFPDFYKENEFEYLKFLHLETCNSYGVLLIRPKGEQYWTAIYDIIGGCSKTDIYNPDIINIQKNDIFIRVCEECDWWGTYAFVKLNLNDYTITFIESERNDNR